MSKILSVSTPTDPALEPRAVSEPIPGTALHQLLIGGQILAIVHATVLERALALAELGEFP